MTREERLMPGGVPKWIRCYDDGGKSIDRYTVVYTQARGKFGHGESMYVGMNDAPFWPQGFCQHGTSHGPIDRPTSGHLGKRIQFQDLPEDCQKVVRQDYQYYWDLTP